ncbi:muts domain V-domain-containing protein [Mycena belliarum]|uniref:DNA mismatch repair protein n=1 Tax=Mycena belliarum TaxID=1033014 RepID=A0AAD6U9A5_9AGAR|nr:muts domain V-domain-containing protein [Mycena belliae]
MPPKSTKPSADAPKQKSLMTWFGKAPAKPVAKPTPKLPPSSNAPQTPESKRPDVNVLNYSAAASTSSYGDSSSKETPPTSDAVIDVDMLTSEEEDRRVRVKTGKRKIIMEDSDEERMLSEASSVHQGSSPGIRKAPKKPRLSALLSDDEEDEVAKSASSSFSKRITHFKKSPAKSSMGLCSAWIHTLSTLSGINSRSVASDDDTDFIEPSDSDFETKSHKSSKSASSHSGSSRRSAVSDDDSEEEDTALTKKSKARSSAKKAASNIAPVATSGTRSFLTQAEQRQQEKKNEKKESESPYAFLADIRDKDGIRPDDPKYDPRTLYIPAKAWKEFTPFEKQFWEIKQNHYDTILFFQKGKFLELYEDDARVGHQQFDLKLTQRVKMSMVGVPESSFNFWAAKFLGRGYKVGRVDQAETALGAEMRMKADKSKGKVSADKTKEKIVRRELNKVYTNGTLLDPEMLTDDQAGHFISICENFAGAEVDSISTFGVSVLDCSTSQFNLSTFEDDICRTKLETLMRQLRPKELLFSKGQLSVSTTRLLKAVLPAACLWTGLREVEGFDYDQTMVELRKLYPATDEDDMDNDAALPSNVPEPIREMLGSRSAIESLGSMIWYLRQLNIDKDILSMKNFNVYDPMKRGQGLILDGQTLSHIEVLLNNEGTEEGSLLKLLSRAVTPFGKRLFRIWLCMPLKDISDINARLDAVEDIMNHPTFESDFMEIAKGLPDLERIVSRIHAKNCTIRDFLKVLAAFKKLSHGLNRLSDTAESFESKTILGLLRSSPDLIQNIKKVQAMYEKPESEKDASELVPQAGKDEVYDKIMEEIGGLENELDEKLEGFQKKLKCKLSWFHSSTGTKDIYLVETNVGQATPKDWIKSQSLKNRTRYQVGSLLPTIRALKEARENRNGAIKAFRFRLFAEFDTDRSIWLRAVRVFAELDCLFCLAKASVAIGEPSCRPVFVEGDAAWLDFKELRHPTLCLNANLKSFIPNDIKLGGGSGSVALLTGPNMAGKSTVMRMTATGVIMAQLGMFVPAAEARLCPVDAILTRMGAYDNMFSNASTFKVELDECCKILRDATPKSLVILDELGRGTSTYDGMAIAGAVLHQLATHTLPLSIFATHYGSLTDDFAYHPNIRNVHMASIVDEEKRDIVFLYKLIEGVATSSFGTHVANLAGVPLPVVERADLISKRFAQQFKEKSSERQKKNAIGRLPLAAQADFAYLFGLGTGKIVMDADPMRRKEILVRLKKTVRCYVHE